MAPVPSATPDSSGRSGLLSALSVSFCRSTTCVLVHLDCGLYVLQNSLVLARTPDHPRGAGRWPWPPNGYRLIFTLFTSAVKTRACATTGARRPEAVCTINSKAAGPPLSAAGRRAERGGEGGWSSAAQVRDWLDPRSHPPSALRWMSVVVCPPTVCLTGFMLASLSLASFHRLEVTTAGRLPHQRQRETATFHQPAQCCVTLLSSAG